ncbi:MtN3 and saliva related transmembrane protein [Albimonas donghaensis]|uniref:MtN3 and saliva related transmembrane protein n=1 Tax=Albimonas donghaensis TaxID=356660 RepID=A0A1H3EHK4_9RHOB|nr:SemiSWEET transporter [Albimonas donghaensis]SDX77419.1 MtN3 and saliva related transmembrane protein [Albimonas donghaensis]
MTDPIEMMGYAAAALTTLSFLPQVFKTWASGSARDLSLGMLLAFFAGVDLWLVYGLAIGDGPLAAANGVTAALVASLLFLKLREMARDRNRARAG